MKKLYIKIVTAFLLSLTLSWAYLVMPQAFFSLDKRLRDFMFVLRGELPKNNSVVIIDIDEKSLKKYGQWPWHRDLFAELLNRLSEGGAGIIGLDIVFAEEDSSSPHQFEKYLDSTKNLPNFDEILARSLTQTPTIGGYILTFEPNGEDRTPMIPAVFLQKGMGLGETSLLKPTGIVLNLELLQDSFYSSGFFNNTPDEGGMIRSVPLVMEYDGVIYSSLALEMIRIYSQQNKVTIIGDDIGVSSVEFGKFKIPTDKYGRLVVNFRGAGKYFQHISASDILSGDYNRSDIEAKFVLVGTSAVGLFDLRSIPFDNTIAGVEVHANVIDNILQGDFLSQPSEIVIYDLLVIWTIIFLFLLLFSFIGSWLIVPFAVVILYGLYTLSFYMLFTQGIVFNLLFPFVAYVLTLISSVGIDYFIESGQRKKINTMLGKKVSPAVRDYLLEHSDEHLAKPKEKMVTIFFSDIRSFTTISEVIGSPVRLIAMLNTYMTPMVENIVKYHGTIDKFIGDAIMAYWNAPIDIENHADKALQSAIEQIEMLKSVNAQITPEYNVTIDIGIGIHTGVVTAGDMGAEGRSDYTIIGDNVNLASRLEGLTKQYGAQILISKITYSLLQESYKIRPIDLVEVKGKSEAVEIFEVICSNKTILDEEMQMYEKATKYFRDSDVKDAYKLYLMLEEKYPSKLYALYVQRCEHFINNPEVEFTQILKMTTK